MESGDEIGDFGVHQGSLDGKVRQLLTQTRAIGDEILAVDGLHIVLAQLVDALLRGAEVVLVDAEVGDGGLQLDGSCVGDDRTGHMDLHAGVKDVCHVGNLLQLGDAAAVAGVGLDELDGVVFEEVVVAPAGVDPLTGGQRRADALAQLLHHVGVQHGDRLLVSHHIVLVAQLADADGRGQVGLAVVLDDDVNIGELLADGSHAALDPLIERTVGEAFLGQVRDFLGVLVVGGEVDLHRVVALADGVADDVHILLVGAPGTDLGGPAELQLTCVAAQLVTALAAQQLVDGHAQSLALDVPQCDVQSGHTGEDDHAAALTPEGALQDCLPNQLGVHGVHADDMVGHVDDHAIRCGITGAVSDTRFAVAVDAFIGIDAATDRITGAALFAGIQNPDVYFRNLHGALLLFMISALVDSSLFRSLDRDAVAVPEGHFAQLVAQTWQIGDGELAVHRLVIVDAQLLVVRAEGVGVMLVDDEVRDGAFQMQGCRRGQGAAAGMDLNADIEDMGHIADLLDLGDAATGANVRLDDLNGILLEVLDVLPAGIDALTVCDRQARFVMDELG